MSETVNACANCGHDRRNHGDDKAPQWERPCGVMGGSGPCDCPGFRAGLTGAPRDTDLSALREAAKALDEKLARWVDRHWSMEYPFQPQWLAVHKALYGHDRKPVLSPCAGDHSEPPAPRETAAAPALDVELLESVLLNLDGMIETQIPDAIGTLTGSDNDAGRHDYAVAVAAEYERLRAARLSASGTTE